MIRFVAITLFVISLAQMQAQSFADKNYYLIDSLDLKELPEVEKELIKSSLDLYHKAKNDTDKLNALGLIIEQSWEDKVWPKYNKVAYELAIKKLSSATNPKVKRKLQIEKAKALSNFGYEKLMFGDYDEATAYFQKSIKINRELNYLPGMAFNLNNLAGVYEITGEVERALDLFLEALGYLRTIGDTNLIGATLNNIGGIYDNMDQLDAAIEFYNEAIELQTRAKNWQGVSTTLNNLGTIHTKKYEYDSSMECFKKSLQLLIDHDIDRRGQASTLTNIGDIYYRKEQYQDAKEYYFQSLAIQEEYKDKFGIANSYRNLGRSALQLGNLQEADKYMKISYDISKEIGAAILIRDAALKYSQVSEARKDYKNAFGMFKIYINMRDSLVNERLQKATLKQHAKYEYEKQKALDDAAYEKQLAIEQEEKEKQQILTYSTAGGLGLVGVFLIFVVNRLKVTRRQKGMIELAHAELGEKNQEILDSINYAKRIQHAILPPDKLVKEYLEQSFILYKPKDIVAGDFYWMECVGDKVLFAAADCTGHGVPGAMVSVVCNNGLNRSVREHKLLQPGKILDKTREIVVQEFEKSEDEVKDGMDIALCVLDGKKLEFAGAHNPLWIIRKGSNEIEEIKGDKQPIGQYDAKESFTNHTVQLNDGDTFYVFSDGFADQFGGEKGKKMKTANFKKLLLQVKDQPMFEQKKVIDKAFEDWKGDLEQLDDVCVIGVRV